jgi:hypothetical protein
VQQGGRWETPTVISGAEVSGVTGARILSAVLTLELLWLLLVTVSIVFLAAHLGPGAEEFTGDATVRGVLLTAAPVLAVLVGLALIGARQAIDHMTSKPTVPLGRTHRLALWVTAVANAAVVVTILVSLYHAHMTWLAVGLLLATGLSAVTWACVRTTRQYR